MANKWNIAKIKSIVIRIYLLYLNINIEFLHFSKAFSLASIPFCIFFRFIIVSATMKKFT